MRRCARGRWHRGRRAPARRRARTRCRRCGGRRPRRRGHRRRGRAVGATASASEACWSMVATSDPFDVRIDVDVHRDTPERTGLDRVSTLARVPGPVIRVTQPAALSPVRTGGRGAPASCRRYAALSSWTGGDQRYPRRRPRCRAAVSAVVLAGLFVSSRTVLDAELEEDRRTDGVVAVVDGQAELDVGVDGVEPLVLQLVRPQLVGDADAAPLVTAEVDDDADGPSATMRRIAACELRTAVAAPGPEHVAGQALAVDPHEHRRRRRRRHHRTPAPGASRRRRPSWNARHRNAPNSVGRRASATRCDERARQPTSPRGAITRSKRTSSPRRRHGA